MLGVAVHGRPTYTQRNAFGGGAPFWFPSPTCSLCSPTGELGDAPDRRRVGSLVADPL